MLAPERLLQLQKYNFDLLAHQEPSGRQRLRYIALAHIKDGKTPTETTLALGMTPRAVTHRLKWFFDEGSTTWPVYRITGVRSGFLCHREKPFARQSSSCSIVAVAAACAEKMLGS